MIGFVGVDVGNFLLWFFDWFLRAAKTAHRFSPFLFFSCSHSFLSQLAHKNRAPDKHRKPTNQWTRAEREKMKEESVCKTQTQSDRLLYFFFVNFFFNIMGMGWFVMQINRKSKFNFDKLKLATSSTFPFNIISYVLTYRASVEFYIRRFLTSRLRNFIRLALLSFELRL